MKEVLNEFTHIIKAIETFPDHKHVGGDALPSKDKLIDVLQYIDQRLR